MTSTRRRGELRRNAVEFGPGRIDAERLHMRPFFIDLAAIVAEQVVPCLRLGAFVENLVRQRPQLGMVVRWQRLREPGWRSSRLLNGLGAAATGIVAVVVAVTLGILLAGNRLVDLEREPPTP